MQFIWAILWTIGTVVWPSSPEPIINIFSSSISLMKSTQSLTSVSFVTALTAYRNFIMVLIESSLLISSILRSSHTRRKLWMIWAWSTQDIVVLVCVDNNFIAVLFELDVSFLFSLLITPAFKVLNSFISFIQHERYF